MLVAVLLRLALVYMRVAANVAVGLGAGVSAGECWHIYL